MNHELLCAICFQPVDLKKSKNDEDGRPVHEDCYAMKIKSLDKPKKPHRVSKLGEGQEVVLTDVVRVG